MVRTNGVDVALALQQLFEGSPTPLPPFVAMTANTSAQDVARCGRGLSLRFELCLASGSAAQFGSFHCSCSQVDAFVVVVVGQEGCVGAVFGWRRGGGGACRVW